MLSQHRIFASHDVDESGAFAGRIWERNRVRINDGSYGLRWNHFEAGRVAFSWIEHDCTVDLRSEGPLSDHFRLFLHRSGWMAHRDGERRFVSHPGNLVVHCPGMDLCSELGPSEFLLVSFDGEMVRHAMDQRFRRMPDYRNWLDTLAESPKTASLRSTIGWLMAEVDKPATPFVAGSKALQHAEHLLLSLLVEGLSEVTPAECESTTHASRAQVERAEAWIDAHLGDPIGVDEVAAATGVGIRSLQLSFRRVHDCTPREFITRRRLEVAHRMLLAADQASTVTAIALQLGFFELGRFSQRYREHFGESPSATLSRRAAGQ